MKKSTNGQNADDPIKHTLLALLLLAAISGTHASAQKADALRNIQVDDYFAIKSVGSPTISPDGKRRQLTHVNQDLLSTLKIADAEEARFMSTDGTTEIQAYIYKPTSFDPNHRYPTLLWLHGGQESQYDYGFNFRVQLFAANGYVVVMPNVRGSGGTDHAEKLSYVDPERLGIGGWSYGGCLTNWVITISDRYEGAVSGAGNALWIANYGHDRYQKWYAMELGLPWETRERWEKASPFNKVQNITTPTIFICGEKDWNVPVINSEQMYQAMKRLGRETQLIVYPNSHHGIRKHSYQKDLLQRFLAWFDKYVKNAKSDSLGANPTTTNPESSHSAWTIKMRTAQAMQVLA